MKYSANSHRVTWLLLGGAFVLSAPSCGGKTNDNSGSGGQSTSGETGSTDDRNDDGIVDNLGETVDQDDDGTPDQIDVDGDGKNDGIAVDTDGDGKPDGAGLDTDDDGIIDAIDTDGDGKPDDEETTTGEGDGDGDTGTGGKSSGGSGGSSTGGASTSAGGSASGGSPSENPGVQKLGEGCGDAGALACAGENQKLQLLCDGSEWVQNGTCSGTAVCDTGEDNRGSCQEPLEGCLDKEPGETYCEESVTRRCGADRVKSELVEACESYCNEEGMECSPDRECPRPSDTTFECGTACEADETRCEQGEGECSFLDLSNVSIGDLQGAYVRLPSGNDLCLEQLEGWECDRKAFIVLLRNSSFQVHIPVGWRARVVPNLSDDSAQYAGLATCGEEFTEGCLEVEEDPQAAGFPAIVLTADEDVPAGNLNLTTNMPCSATN